MSDPSKNKDDMSDERLGELLRSVAVPDDLHEKLLAISGQPAEVTATEVRRPNSQSEPRLSRTRRVWLGLLVTACLLVAVCLVAWQVNSKPNHIVAHSLAQANSIVVQRKEAEEILNGFRQRQRDFERRSLEFGAETIHRNLQSLVSVKPESRRANDVDSMIMAMANQSSLSMGNSQSNVRRAMNELTKQFPGSQGAKLAQEYLNQN